MVVDTLSNGDVYEEDNENIVGEGMLLTLLLSFVSAFPLMRINRPDPNRR